MKLIATFWVGAVILGIIFASLELTGMPYVYALIAWTPASYIISRYRR